MEWDSLIPHAVGTIVGAVGAYVGVRVDLALMRGALEAMRERIANAEKSTTSAHERIDRIMHGKH